MNSALKVIREQVKHFYLIRRLSMYELRSKNSNNLLGMAWEIINPLILISIYWFVFGYGIRGDRGGVTVAPGVEVPFIYWMLAGIVLWFFFYNSVIKGSKSIYSRIKMLSKMNFPMSVIPNYIVFSQFYIHLIMLGIAILIFNFSGYYVSIYYLQFLYFIFSLFVFCFALALLMSTLSTIIRDIQMFLQATLRMVLYLSAILWPISTIPNDTIQMIMTLNPLYYLIEGYRAAFFGIGWYFIDQWEYTLYFWILTLVIFLVAAQLHVRFRRHFIDFL